VCTAAVEEGGKRESSVLPARAQVRSCHSPSPTGPSVCANKCQCDADPRCFVTLQESSHWPGLANAPRMKEVWSRCWWDVSYDVCDLKEQPALDWAGAEQSRRMETVSTQLDCRCDSWDPAVCRRRIRVARRSNPGVWQSMEGC
jgi:hypothetical protein